MSIKYVFPCANTYAHTRANTHALALHAVFVYITFYVVHVNVLVCFIAIITL